MEHCAVVADATGALRRGMTSEVVVGQFAHRRSPFPITALLEWIDDLPGFADLWNQSQVS
jgi:hypothetical protein